MMESCKIILNPGKVAMKQQFIIEKGHRLREYKVMQRIKCYT